MRIVTIVLGAVLLLAGIWGIISVFLNNQAGAVLIGRIAMLLFGIILLTWGIKKKQTNPVPPIQK